MGEMEWTLIISCGCSPPSGIKRGVVNIAIIQFKQTFSTFTGLMDSREWGGVLTDTELVAQAIAGDDDAFLALMLTHKEALYLTALAYLKNKEDALEAVQEVTFRAYEKIHSLKKPEYAKTWLVRIMMNYCRDALHKQKRLLLNENLVMQQGFSEDYTYLEVEEALVRLTDEQRELIHLKYLQDIKIKEIAEMTATPESTVKTRLYKALKVLRSFIEEKGEIRRV